jgi:hypothetical protein
MIQMILCESKDLQYLFACIRYSNLDNNGLHNQRSGHLREMMQWKWSKCRIQI